ncbi:zinc finger protein OZF-like [Manduca sexta]|uniref:zinc finger protein OZF-like n=1 Tax=Manduca sexta TaxID=7130 RepID=UPI00188E5D22|nr:zinc finger protein OZF-like [Manduca sexta]
MNAKICRICLNNAGTILLSDKQNNVQNSDKIFKCTNILICEGDGLPDTMCEGCAQELAISYNFVIKCESSDKVLKSLISAQSKSDLAIKNEDVKLEGDNSLDEPFDWNTEYPEEKGESKLELSTDLIAEFEEHNLEIEEKQQTKYTCNICGSMFALKEVLKRHQETHHERSRKIKVKNKKHRVRSGPIQCVVCGLMVQSRSAMEAHIRTHTGEKPFACDICNMKFNVKGSLKKHIETHHTNRERKFICETCGSRFFRKCEIIAHVRRHTDERPYACKLCPKRFRQISSLIRHKYSHTGERRHSCPICQKSFYDKSAIQKHMSVHSNEKKYTCHLCNKSVKSKSSLYTHLKIHSNEKQVICNICGMTFSLKGNLQTHMRRKHSEKSGQCSVCMKTYPDLEEHMRKHTGERPYACKNCDQAYATKRSLSYHIMFKHENADKYKCSIGECTKTFPTGKLLEMHLLKHHTNHTPYVCPHCSRGFFRTSDLTRHLKGSHMDPTKIRFKTQDQVIIEGIK